MVPMLPAFEVALAAMDVGIRALSEAKGALAKFKGSFSQLAECRSKGTVEVAVGTHHAHADTNMSKRHLRR